LIVPPPAAALALPLAASDGAVDAAGDAALEAPPGDVVEQAATSTIALANAKTFRVMSPPPNRRASVRGLTASWRA
jgi:hypothetical protein